LAGDIIGTKMIPRKIAYVLGTGLGSGYVPYAPGTAGSAAAWLVFYLLPLNDYVYLVLCILVFTAGLWSSALVEKEEGIKDPAKVVIDEWVGQWLALLFLPRIPLIMFVDFVLFRIMDISKPYPAGKSQNIRGGLGIMLDDVIAAVYSNIIMHLVLGIHL
jgi:phosphatidylglycerophosphatase A